MSDKDTIEYEQEAREYEVFMAERRLLIEYEQKQSTSFDKYLLSFSAGTFGLTVTFIREMVPNPNHTTYWMLLVSWGLLIFTILLMLTSFLSGQMANRKQIEIVKKEFVTERDRECRDKNGWALATSVINIAAIAAFVIGIALLFCFVSKNLLT